MALLGVGRRRRRATGVARLDERDAEVALGVRRHQRGAWLQRRLAGRLQHGLRHALVLLHLDGRALLLVARLPRVVHLQPPVELLAARLSVSPTNNTLVGWRK